MRPAGNGPALQSAGAGPGGCLFNAAPHVLIVSITIIIWLAERVRVGAVFDRRLSSERLA
jgi:hypothetical protein